MECSKHILDQEGKVYGVAKYNGETGGMLSVEVIGDATRDPPKPALKSNNKGVEDNFIGWDKTWQSMCAVKAKKWYNGAGE